MQAKLQASWLPINNKKLSMLFLILFIVVIIIRHWSYEIKEYNLIFNQHKILSMTSMWDLVLGTKKENKSDVLFHLSFTSFGVLPCFFSKYIWNKRAISFHHTFSHNQN